MSLVGGDSLTAFSFEFSVDGVTIPNVVSVNSIKKTAPIIETKSMTPTGQYVNQKMYGMAQSGEMSITVLNTGDSSVTSWIMDGLSGNQTSGRKSAKLVYKDTTHLLEPFMRSLTPYLQRAAEEALVTRP